MSTNFSRFYFRTFTATTADPTVLSLTDHGFVEGDVIRLETSGTLPTGLSLLTDYFIVYNGITTDTFQIASAPFGTPIEVTGAGSGTNKLIKRNRANLAPLQESSR